jgi:hypothetical protein
MRVRKSEGTLHSDLRRCPARGEEMILFSGVQSAAAVSLRFLDGDRGGVNSAPGTAGDSNNESPALVNIDLSISVLR